jgi:hypothetical protein
MGADGGERSRTAWEELPSVVHKEVARLLGSPVVEVIPQLGGYSPGSADRVRASNGRRAFVKAVGRDRNEQSIEIHRREAAVMSQMPRSIKVPRFFGSFDDDTWVALVLEDIEGRHPQIDTGLSDAVAVLDALHTIPDVRESKLDLPDVDGELADDFAAWGRIRGAGAIRLPSWVIENSDRLEVASSSAAAAVRGNQLVQLDLRADNVLIDGEGNAVLIDWPWAAVGAGWLDGVTYLLDGRLRGETFGASAVLAQHPLFATVAPHSIDAVLAGLAGMFFERSAQPPPSSMPTLRKFQWDQAIAAVEWLEERWS